MNSEQQQTEQQTGRWVTAQEAAAIAQTGRAILEGETEQQEGDR